MDRPHILYDNRLYYTMKTWEMYSLLKNQDLLIKFTKLLDLSETQMEDIYYKRDCIYFELHRRSFQNCLIQLYSVSKVRPWLLDMDNKRRCECCNLEYYEFHADLRRMERDVQECSNNIANLLANNSLENPSSSTNSEPAIPSGPDHSSHSIANNTASAAQSPADGPSRLLNPLSPNSIRNGGMSSRSNREVEFLLERGVGEIGPVYTPRSILKRERGNFTMFEYKSQSVLKDRIIQTLPFTRNRRRYVTFDLHNSGNNPIQYHYEDHNEGVSSSAAENFVRAAPQSSRAANNSTTVSNNSARVTENSEKVRANFSSETRTSARQTTNSTRNNNVVRFTSRPWSLCKKFFK